MIATKLSDSVRVSLVKEYHTPGAISVAGSVLDSVKCQRDNVLE
jgi:hypothetical protein